MPSRRHLSESQRAADDMLPNGNMFTPPAHENIQRSWVLIGQELRAIRERKLWRGHHQNFEAYCLERWGYSRHRAHQLITAEGVIRNLEQPEWEQENVLTAVNTFSPPTSETHVRPLMPLSPAQPRQAWHGGIPQVGGEAIVDPGAIWSVSWRGNDEFWRVGRVSDAGGLGFLPRLDQAVVLSRIEAWSQL